ncbi:MAG: choline kinase, partial [Clostridiaceae bacterium]|nr:choline kinase [Clostridiaceae bacterium]
LLNDRFDLSQRDLSKRTELSLGKVNYTIKKLVDEDYLIVEKDDNKMSYKLTEKGFKFIDFNLKREKTKKINLHSEDSKNINQAVILAAGRASDFDKPVGFLEIEDFTLIERAINLLFNENIESIVIITGYKHEYFDTLSKDNRIKIIYNDRYKWTGTMYSLSLAKELIVGDFLLVENDLIFEERTLKYLVENSNRDCILVTNETGSGDEAFVEINNGFIYKISKDIHQLNRIDGEMIGLSKISYEVFKLMLEEFKTNKNPYLNYEYLLMDIGRNYNIGYTKIDDLVWAEIDNLNQYNHVKSNIFPRMKRKEMTIRIDKLKHIASEAMAVDINSIDNVQPIGGMTNKNYKIVVKGKNYVLRIPGAGTEEMISRTSEKINSRLAFENGFDSDLIYFNEHTGVKISTFIEKTETLNERTAKKEENMKLIAGILRELHNSSFKFGSEFDPFKIAEEYEKLLHKYNGKNFEDYYEVKEKVMSLKKVMDSFNITKCPCHNDTVPENFIKSGESKIFLIDWEYSGMNDAMWDIAAHSMECNFSDDDEELFLNIYFNGEIDEQHRLRILINKILQDFIWSTWTNIKEAKGDDFGSYGINRYNRAKANLEKLNKKFEELK